MPTQELQPSEFVLHQTYGVGRVTSIEDGTRSVIIDFKDRPSHRMGREVARRSLTVLPDDGLEALIWDQAEEVRPWAKEAPLKLVALALADLGRTGRAGEIREKLEGRIVRDPKWDTWWRKVQPEVKASTHFSIGKANTITLVSPASDVLSEPLVARPNLSGQESPCAMGKRSHGGMSAWDYWLMTGKKGAPPNRRPPEAVLEAAALVVQRDDWRQGLASHLYQALVEDSPATNEFLAKLAPRLTVEILSELVQEILLTAFASVDTDWVCSEADRLLILLEPVERTAVLQHIVVRAAAGELPRSGVLGYLSTLRASKGPLEEPEKLRPLLLASLLLSENGDPLIAQAGRCFSDIVTGPTMDMLDSFLEDLVAEPRRRFADLDQQLADLRASLENQLAEERESFETRFESQRQSYEVQLESANIEQDKLRQRIAGLRTQIAEGREESRLDIRKDMLLIIGETLQTLRQKPGNTEELSRLAEARLALALRAGGAEEFGKVGDSEPFDPRLHQGEDLISKDTTVRISAPGAIVRGKHSGHLVLTKARVVQT